MSADLVAWWVHDLAVACRRRDLPGGWRLYLATTGSWAPPGAGGWAPASSETWLRLVRGEWDSGWHRAELTRSIVRLTQWWSLVERERDIEDAWRITVSDVWPPPRYDESYFRWLAEVGT